MVRTAAAAAIRHALANTVTANVRTASEEKAIVYWGTKLKHLHSTVCLLANLCRQIKST